MEFTQAEEALKWLIKTPRSSPRIAKNAEPRKRQEPIRALVVNGTSLIRKARSTVASGKEKGVSLGRGRRSAPSLIFRKAIIMAL
jgi:hypothetical protein